MEALSCANEDGKDLYLLACKFGKQLLEEQLFVL